MKEFNYPKNLYPFQSKWTNIDGNHIHYVDEGTGEAILFCHPPITSSFMYRNMIKDLSKFFRCIAFDFPGFGLSSATNEYTQSIKSQEKIVRGLLNHLELDSIYFLMQEVGGHAGISVIMKQPDLLKGIIITDTIIFPVSQYPIIKRMLNLVNSSFFNLINTNFNFLIRAFTRFGIQKRKLSKAERRTYKEMFNTRQIRRTTTKMLHQLVEEEKLLGEVQIAFETTLNKTPALIIYGEKDPLTQLEIPQRIHKLLPNSQLHWIKDEAHFPHEGAPGEMSELISSWLRNQNKSNGTRAINAR